jgi:hypothetical protein
MADDPKNSRLSPDTESTRVLADLLKKAAEHTKNLDERFENIKETLKEETQYLSENYDLSRKMAGELGKQERAHESLRDLVKDTNKQLAAQPKKIETATAAQTAAASTLQRATEEQQTKTEAVTTTFAALSRSRREIETARANGFSADTIKGLKAEIKEKQRAHGLAQKEHKLAKDLVKTAQENFNIADQNLTTEVANLPLLRAKLITYTEQLSIIGASKAALSDQVRVLNSIDRLLGSSGEEYGKIKSLVMDVAKGGLTAWLALLQASLERWKELDKAAGDFRIKTGFLVSQTRELNNSAREVNVEMAQIGVGLDEAYGAASALTNQFQVIGIVTKDMVKDTAQMAANLGISVEDSAKIRSIFTSISKSSGITATQMMGAAARLAEMGGVAPAMVMKDIAEASEDSLKFLSKSPLALMKAAVEARRLGTTINSLSKSSRGFLNFQDSITSELTASAMVGKSLNFQAARRAAWEKDIVKSRQLALKEISKLGDFNKLNILQQEEVAKAAHMTVDEIIQQQNQTKILAALEKERPEMFKEYMAMQKKLREDEKAGTNDLVKQGEELVKRQMRQTELNKLTNSFKQIWTDISDALLPIANIIMPIIITAVRLLVIPIKIIAGLVRGFLSAFDGIGKSLRSGESGAMSLEKVMVKIGSATETVSIWMEKIGETVARLINLFAIFKISIGKAADAFKPFNAIDKFFKRISAGFLNMSKGTKTFAQSFSHFARDGTILGNIFKNISSFITKAKTGMSAWFGEASKIGGVLKGIKTSMSAWFGEGSKIGGMLKGIKDMAGGVGAFIARWFSGARFFSGRKNVFSTIKNLFSGGSVSMFKPLLSIFSGVGGVFGPIFKGLSTLFKFAGVFAKFLGPIGLIINAVQVLWELGSQLMDIWSDDNLNIGQKILKSILAIPGAIFDVLISPFIDIGVWVLRKFGFDIPDEMVVGIKSVSKKIFQAITMPFAWALDWLYDTFLGKSPSQIGLGIVDGLASVGSMIFDALSSPFKKVMNFVSGIFGKNVGIARMIVDAIKSMGGTIFNTLSSAFKKVMEFVSSIPLIGRFFGGKDASKAAIEAKSIVESKINHMVEIVNMDELKMSIDKLTDAISSLGGAAGGATPVVNVNNNSDAMISKLDELINLLTGGAVAVHMDGTLVSKALARVS